jgi:RNA recognition motif-containing protein
MRGKFDDSVSFGTSSKNPTCCLFSSYLPGPDFGLFSALTRKVNLQVRRPIFIKENSMGSKLYVGNLSYDVTGSDLQSLFAPHGTITSAEIIADRDTGRSKGFGFVQMGSQAEAEAAIAALNGQDHSGRALTVNVAKPREERPRSSSGGGNRGGNSRY